MAADGIEDDVHATAPRNLADLFSHVRVAVVDRVVYAERAERVMLERGRRADDRRTAEPRELRGGYADATAGVVHEHRFTDVERRHPVERDAAVR